jgi:multimeric flavodoxin WrbA
MSSRRVLLLDGRRDDDATLVSVRAALDDGLRACGLAVDHWLLRDEAIAPCTGCFGCWVKTPGVCVNRDAGRAVAERIMKSDLLIFLTPVTFGGYSSELKKALDHIIPILLPHFRAVDGGTRHRLRYAEYPDLLAVGVLSDAAADPALEAETFRELVARNALNFRPEHWAAGVVPSEAGPLEIGVIVSGLLGKVGARGELVSIGHPRNAAFTAPEEVAS